jgi:hypothetical protein
MKILERNKELPMRHHPVLRGIRIAIFVIIGAAVFGFIVESLWNVLIPPIFGWHTITFWQALGLLLLSKILFGGFHRHGGGGRDRWKQRMKERWEQMTPEEREKFRKGMRCGRAPFTSTVEPQV